MTKQTTRNSLGISICIAVLACSPAGNAQDCSTSKMTLKIQKYELDYRLKNNSKNKKCVTIGSTYQLEIKLIGADPVDISVGAIRVHEKSGTLSIRGENVEANPESMSIEIDGTASGDGSHQFYITVDGVGTIDPIVKVVDSNLYRLALREALQAFSEDFDLQNATIEIKSTTSD
jgi:hypothetical protein